MIWAWDACSDEPLTYVLSEYLIPPPEWFERCYTADGEEVCIDEAVYRAPALVYWLNTTATSGEDSGVDPPRGGCVLIDAQARDEAGNMSTGECQ